MFGLIVEYTDESGRLPALALRWQYRDLLARQPGYLRRLELQADGYRRVVDLFLFASGAEAEATLACEEHRRFAAENPTCGACGLALLVREGDGLGTPAVLLRRTKGTSPTGEQLCWRDTLHPATPVVELW